MKDVMLCNEKHTVTDVHLQLCVILSVLHVNRCVVVISPPVKQRRMRWAFQSIMFPTAAWRYRSSFATRVDAPAACVTAGAKTRRVRRAGGGGGVCDAPLPCRWRIRECVGRLQTLTTELCGFLTTSPSSTNRPTECWCTEPNSTPIIRYSC